MPKCSIRLQFWPYRLGSLIINIQETFAIVIKVDQNKLFDARDRTYVMLYINGYIFKMQQMWQITLYIATDFLCLSGNLSSSV